MVRRLQLLPLLWLVVVWVVAWGSYSPMILFGGLVAGLFVTLASPLPRLNLNATVRPWALLVLVVLFLKDLAKAVWDVSMMALLPGRTTDAAIITVRFAADEELFQTITSELITLVPGTMVIDLDDETRVAHVHCLGVKDEADAEAVRQECLEQERRVLAAFDADYRREDR
ncbi:Na+/H+ antiporter subunit E [Kytococcus schroeteri]|uniref:Na+/H+ antiporter subunit E n=1 Tax=Kytococcus schroeteri TaxID=138300 RepID=A0A2I1PA81_9MICO|nr:Na+/H+ antiporter subunit E [Kytococcus schroeteri]PKZ41532.1 Na+/H+ antiporter subunit E [Kytococcus schroeteri]